LGQAVQAQEAIASRVEALGPWFHDLDLQGVRTAPDHPLGRFHHDIWSTIEHVFPADMSGATVLDIGCNGGFYTFQLWSRGARVTGIDHDPRYLAQARYAAEVLEADVELLELDAYDVERLGRGFDYVLFMGVLYHLRHPLLALDRIAPLARRRAVVQSLVAGPEHQGDVAEDYDFRERAIFDQAGFPGMYFVEHRYAGDPTNWWVPNEAGLAAMIRSSGMVIEEHAGPGIYVCRPGGGA